MCCFKKIVLLTLFLLFFAGTNLYLLSQETLPDTVWTKNLYPDKIVASRFINNDTQVLVVAMSNIFIFDTQTGQLVIKKSIKEILDNQDAGSIDLSNINNTFAVSSYNGKVAFFDMTNLDTIKTINFPFNISGLAYSKNFEYLYIVESYTGFDPINNVHIFDLKQNKISKSIGDDGRTLSITFDNMGKYSATVSYHWNQAEWSENIKLWEYNSNKIINTFFSGEKGTTDLEFSPDGKYLASSSMDGTIKIWDVEQRKLWKEYKHEPVGITIFRIAFSPDSKYIVFSTGLSGNFITYVINIDNLLVNQSYNYAGYNDIDISKNSKLMTLSEEYKLSMINAKWTMNDINNQLESINLLYPNPTTNSINIEFNLQNSENVIIDLTDISGNTLSNILNELLESGKNTIPYNCHSLPQGIYFIKISSPSFKATYKLIKEG